MSVQIRCEFNQGHVCNVSFCQKQGRIDSSVIEINTPVQVRSGYSPGLADSADLIAGTDNGTGLDIDRVHVAVEADQAMTMVHDDGVAVEEIITSGENNTRCWRVDGRAFIGGDIHTGMGIARLLVKKALKAERTATDASHRRLHAKNGCQRIVPTGECPGHLGTLTIYSHHIFSVRIYLASIANSKVLFNILLEFDGELQ